MVRDALARLVSDAQALPQADVSGDAPLAGGLPRGEDRRHRARPSPDDALSPSALTLRVRGFLEELARRVDAELPATLHKAEQAWDQVDAMRVVNRAMAEEARALSAAARLLQATDDPPLVARGLEAQLTLDAALGLASLVERRLATLIRLRLRAGEPSLFQDGQPFLDLGAALHEAARRWT